MQAALDVLAIVGAAAVLWRFGRALVRALGRLAELVAAGQAVDVRRQRGDLTGMAEASAWREAAGRRRIRALASCGLWAALLVVPLYTSWAQVLFAAYSALWLFDVLPPARRRPT